MPAIDPARGERLLELANQLEEILDALRGQAYALQRDPDAKRLGVREVDALLKRHYSKEPTT
jgi:hypothetical protein